MLPFEEVRKNNMIEIMQGRKLMMIPSAYLLDLEKSLLFMSENDYYLG